MRVQIEIPYGSDVFRVFKNADSLFVSLKKEGYFNTGNPGGGFITSFNTRHYHAIAKYFREDPAHNCVALAPASIRLFLAVINQVSIALISTKASEDEFVNWLAYLQEPERSSFVSGASVAVNHLNASMYMLVQSDLQAEVA